ncbi:MAG TPA: SprB repeat-containing protein, partial [Bacteroidia bacterium]|nr:SprB repeat-containing protein [Bacteroidia bacterium]
MKKTLLLSQVVLTLFVFSAKAFGQASACPAVTTGTVAPVCSGQCVNLSATVQGTLQTNTYTVSSIPYSPYSYTTGTAVLVNIDDVWTPVINMPFCFEFFGNTYNQLVIGSNGLISFNTAYANAFCQWSYTAPIPTNTEPMNTIMAPYHDIDPSIGSTSDTRYQVYGTAPCREFVISWYHVPMFSAACNSMLATQQIVLHESTNIIDIYIENKPLCAGWNGGRATEGIQNATGTVAFFVPGRNASQWSVTNDGYRFMPAGTPNYSLQWTGPSGVVGTTATVNVCPTTTTTYTCTVTNTSCSGPIVVSATETVTVSSGITTSGTQNNVTCNGSCNGSATTNIVSGTGPFTYVWSPAPGGGQGTGTATGLCAGTYSCTVSNPTGCSTTQVFTITQPPVITATQSQVNVTCNGSCNGSATVNAAGGNGTYSYNWSPAPGGGQGTPTATGLCAGTYTCTISSPAGCSITKIFTITQPPAITATQSQVNVNCNGSCNGSATVNPSGGSGSFTYTWSPAPGGGQGTGNATGLCAGTYTCTIADATAPGCSITKIFTITQPSAITATQSQVNVNCNGSCNGSATVNPSGGSGSFTYTWSPAPGGGQGTGNATGLCAGTYTCTIADAAAPGCSITKIFTITQPPAITA